MLDTERWLGRAAGPAAKQGMVRACTQVAMAVYQDSRTKRSKGDDTERYSSGLAFCGKKKAIQWRLQSNIDPLQLLTAARVKGECYRGAPIRLHLKSRAQILR